MDPPDVPFAHGAVRQSNDQPEGPVDGPMAAADPEPAPGNHGVSHLPSHRNAIANGEAPADPKPAPSRQERRPRLGLKDTIRTGSANFEFDALLQGVSTAPSRPDAVNARDGADLLWIPPGEFLMGSDNGDSGEGPVHPVLLDGFWIYRTPVTVAQYRVFYASLGRPLRSEPHWGWQDDHPMVNVNWEYACEYARWAGAALPTEAQWEYAARGTDGRLFPWGNEWDPEKCRHSVSAAKVGVSTVGSYLPGASPFGVLDMAGNVWEWTADWYDQGFYRVSPRENPTGPDWGTHRVLRGGSWGNTDPRDYRTTVRVQCDPGARGPSIGFRCIIPPTTLPPP
jgi:sulfatase modifying factor 1